MGYFMTSATRERVAGESLAHPKTHTPFSRVKERGARFYSPNLGRWVSRDPVGELGGRNVYVFTADDPVNGIDNLGLVTMTIEKWPIKKMKCGVFSTSVDFLGGFTASYSDMWIIQHTIKVVNITKEGRSESVEDPITKQCRRTCESCKAVNYKAVDNNFYEAFPISSMLNQGGRLVWTARDSSSGYTLGDCKCGNQTTTKVAIYRGQMARSQTDPSCPDGFTLRAPNPTEANTCYTYREPDWWRGNLGAPDNVVKYGLKSKWECCPGVADTDVDWFTPP